MLLAAVLKSNDITIWAVMTVLGTTSVLAAVQANGYQKSLQ